MATIPWFTTSTRMPCLMDTRSKTCRCSYAPEHCCLCRVAVSPAMCAREAKQKGSDEILDYDENNLFLHFKLLPIFNGQIEKENPKLPKQNFLLWRLPSHFRKPGCYSSHRLCFLLFNFEKPSGFSILIDHILIIQITGCFFHWPIIFKYVQITCIVKTCLSDFSVWLCCEIDS